ncbi:RNA-directed DNA polymerase, eukaryota [Tanacetum coccineum]
MEFNLEGAAADWFRWMSRNGLITTWARFEKSVKNRFGSSKYEDPRGSLSKLLQLGTVEDYQREFEKLMNRVTDIPDSLRISFYISRLKLNLQHEMLVSSPTTLGDAFSIARITEARFEATAEKERYIKEKAYTTLTLPSEEASPVVKGPLYASEDTLQSLRSEDPNFKIQEKAIEYVRALNVAPLEVVFVGLVDEVRGKFAEFSEDKGCVERNVTPWAADGGRRKRVKCYVQGSGRRKMKKVIGRGSGSTTSSNALGAFGCGPDGFSFDFIRTFWDILKHDFVNAIREFFISSKFPPGCNSSFIALIPKKHDAKFVKDYRPISLIGCFYKIVSKILANRLKMVISELISDVQSAFVSNRQILDGPFILNELISWCKAHKSKAMIFKVDFEKAFDSVRWDFLDIILRNFGFGIKWRGWIQGCLSSAMGSILVNGSPTAEFKFHKGLKQGDPLSPYLFILVMESLHLSFNNIINADLFKGIRFDDSLTLSHLFYADDAVFIGKWDRANILTIVRMLKCFFLASGLQINILKSKLMGIGVSNEEVLAAANIIGCSTFSTPFSYLGVKVGMSPSRRKAWDEIIGKVSNRLSKWKIKTLSVGGRLTLIKSVLTSLPLYHMSLYKAPLGVLRDLESLRRKFFNGADINEKRFSMISWNKILASKQKGGLGVSSFFALNRSLLFKWVWRFLSQDASLWHRLIAVLYGNRSPFVHTGSVSSLSPWNCILKELNSLSAKGINLLALLKKKVGNGANTLFWEDCWINDVPLSRSFPRLYALELKKGITVADKLIDASFVASFRRNPRGGVEEEQLHHLVELVGSISLSPSNDRWAWLLGSSGEFSVHSARTFIDDILLPFVGDVTRWVKVVPIKVNILAWKVCLDKLPTRLNLSLRGIDIPSIICPNCGLAGESCSHLFYSCNLARTLWRKIARWWEIDIPDFSCYEEWIAWFKTTRFSKAQKEMLEGVFYVMWWMIWKFRNQVLFGSSHPRMELLFDDIVSYSFTWCSNRCKNNIDWISWMKCPKSISL